MGEIDHCRSVETTARLAQLMGLCYFDIVLVTNLLFCIGVCSSTLIIQTSQRVDIVYLIGMPLAVPHPDPAEGCLQLSFVREHL